MATRKKASASTSLTDGIEGYRPPKTKQPIIVGLDISTSVVGVCVLRESLTQPLHLGWVKLSRFNTLWDKSREIQRVLLEVRDSLAKQYPDVEVRVAYEEPLIHLSSMSSAGTITKLSRFNGQVGLLASQVFGDEYPAGLTVHVCRKAAKIKINRSDKRPHKEQAFEQVCSQIGSDWVIYKQKRDGTTVPRDECLDASDAWVVAAALWNIHRGE